LRHLITSQASHASHATRHAPHTPASATRRCPATSFPERAAAFTSPSSPPSTHHCCWKTPLIHSRTSPPPSHHGWTPMPADVLRDKDTGEITWWLTDAMCVAGRPDPTFMDKDESTDRSCRVPAFDKHAEKTNDLRVSPAVAAPATASPPAIVSSAPVRRPSGARRHAVPLATVKNSNFVAAEI